MKYKLKALINAKHKELLRLINTYKYGIVLLILKDPNISEEYLIQYGDVIINAFTTKYKLIKQNKEIIETNHYCHIYRPYSEWQPLNLGECHNGDKFQSLKHAINQAKEICPNSDIYFEIHESRNIN